MVAMAVFSSSLEFPGNCLFLHILFYLKYFMLKKSLLIICICFFTISFLKSQSLTWAKQFGNKTSNEQYWVGSADRFGNIITVGGLDSLDLDPSDTGVHKFYATGSGDCFISKLNSTGKYKWAKQIGYKGWAEGLSVKTDDTGNIFVTGHFSDIIDIDPGPSQKLLYVSGGKPDYWDIFVLKLDSNGNYKGHIQLGSTQTQATDDAFQLDLDDQGNVYLIGEISGTVDFDPGPDTSALTGSFLNNIFVAKYSNSLAYKNAVIVSFSSLNTNRAEITVYKNSDVLITSAFSGSADFDPGTGSDVKTAKGKTDGFVLNLDQNLKYKWCKQYGGSGGSGSVYPKAICTDNNGNIYSAGSYRGNVDVNPDTGTVSYNNPSSSWDDVYVQKLNIKGDFKLAGKLAGISYEDVGSVRCDSENDFYITGSFSDSVDFNPNGTRYMLFAKNPPSTFAYNAYFAKYDTGFHLKFAHSIGKTSYDYGFYMDLNPIGSVVEWIGFRDTVDFDPGPNKFNLISKTSLDMSIAQYSQSAYIESVKPAANSICPGSSVSVQITGNLNSCRKWYIYTGNCGDTLIDSTTNNTFSVTPKYTATYFVRGEGSKIGASMGNCVSFKITVLPVSITEIIISSNDSTRQFCENQKVIFSASTKNPGSLPKFQWVKNGKNVGINNRNYTDSSLKNNDSIWCMLTSNAICPVPKTSTSNMIFVKVVATTKPTITIHSNANNNSICEKQNITFTADTTNAGLNPQFQWFVNSNKINLNDIAYSDSTLKNNDTVSCLLISSKICAIPASVKSGMLIVHTLNSPDTKFNLDVCDSIKFKNQMLKKTGLYEFSYKNQFGCDSNYILNLTVNNSWRNEYQLQGCKYVAFDNKKYTSSGTYIISKKTIHGCDSISTLKVTVDTLNTTIVREMNTLKALDLRANYQWLNCDSGYSKISGATDSALQLSRNGEFAVDLRYNTCRDTSNCILITNLSEISLNSSSDLRIFPNPTNGEFQITSEKINQVRLVRIYDPAGRLIFKTDDPLSLSGAIDLSSFNSGIYLIELHDIHGYSVYFNLIRN